MTAKPTNQSQPGERLSEWIAKKTAACEDSINGRVQAENAWRNGTPKQWANVGNFSSKADRMKYADKEKRIADMLRSDLAMWRELAVLVEESAALTTAIEQAKNELEIRHNIP